MTPAHRGRKTMACNFGQMWKVRMVLRLRCSSGHAVPVKVSKCVGYNCRYRITFPPTEWQFYHLNQGMFIWGFYFSEKQFLSLSEIFTRRSALKCFNNCVNNAQMRCCLQSVMMHFCGNQYYFSITSAGLAVVSHAQLDILYNKAFLFIQGNWSHLR